MNAPNDTTAKPDQDEDRYQITDALMDGRPELPEATRNEIIEYAKRADAAIDRRHRNADWCMRWNVTIMTIGAAFVSFTFETYGLWSLAIAMPFISVIGLISSRHSIWEICIQREYVTAKFYTLREADKHTALRLENREREIRKKLQRKRTWRNGRRRSKHSGAVVSDRYDMQMAHWWRIGWIAMLIVGLGVLIIQATITLSGNTIAIVPIGT